MSELNSTQIKAIAKERAELNRHGWFLSTVSKPSYIMGFEEGVEYAQKLANEVESKIDTALHKQNVMESAFAEIFDKAACIQHWHNTGKNDEGMVVSSKKIHDLWGVLEKYRDFRHSL